MDTFKCHLCAIAFDDGVHTPRMMPDCWHTYCQNCIQKRIFLGPIVCPECPQDDLIYQKHSDIDDFPINTAIIQILKKNPSQPSRRIQTTPTLSDYYPSKYEQNDLADQKYINERNRDSDQSDRFNIEPQIKLSEQRVSSQQTINKSFETLPSWRLNEEDELKRLLTPSNFLQNLLGSLHDQQSQIETKRSSVKSEQLYQQLNTMPQYQSEQQFNKHQQEHLAQQTFQIQQKQPNINSQSQSQTYVDGDGIQSIIAQKENTFKETIGVRFKKLVNMLQSRERQIMTEVHTIFENIQQGFIKAQFQNQAMTKDLDEYLEQILQKVQTEFQLQIELIIPRYCTIRNQIENSDYLMPHQRTPSFDQQFLQQTPAFNGNLNQDYQIKRDEGVKINNKNNVDKSPTNKITQDNQPTSNSQLFFKAQMKTEPDETVFHTFENNKTAYTQPPQFGNSNQKTSTIQNYSLPYDITNYRQPNYETNRSTTQKKNISPQRRIFDDVPITSPLIRAKQPLFSTPNKSTPSDGGHFELILDKLKRGDNVEHINLKDQNIGDTEIQKLAEQLKFTTSFVRTVILSRNLITNEGLGILLEGLRKNKTIKSLNLKRNKLTDKCIEMIYQEYRTKKTNYLSQLFLKGNQIDFQQHIQIQTKIQNLGIVIY